MSAVRTAAEPATARPVSATTAGAFTLPANPFEAGVDWSALAESLLNQIAQFFGRLLWAVAIILVGWGAISLIVQPILRRIISNRQLDPILGQFVVIMVSSILKFFLISTAIGVLGVEQLSIAAFVAFFGVGVGQGVSGIMKDFIAGLILVVQKPIRHGDWVDASGADGEVIHVGLTHTTIRSSQRCHNIVPNSNITSNRIVNFNKEEIMRVHVELLVPPHRGPATVPRGLS
jgi:small conductance mechanosensitive channel